MPTKILVIDDDIRLTDMLEELLVQHSFEVMTANSGQDGIEAARQWQPDAIVLDLMMPELDGWQVCQAIRAFSQASILVLSAVVESEGVMQALERGANDYLVKPVPIAVLVSHIRKMIHSARPASQDVSTHDDE